MSDAAAPPVWSFPENFDLGEFVREVWATVSVPELGAAPILVKVDVDHAGYDDLEGSEDPEVWEAFASAHPPESLVLPAQLALLDRIRTRAATLQAEHLPRVGAQLGETSTITISTPVSDGGAMRIEFDGDLGTTELWSTQV